MGLTTSSTGNQILNNEVETLKKCSDFTIALCGNPNVRKKHYL